MSNFWPVKEKETTRCLENISAIILAAGKGSRMQSDLPKVLTPLAGKTLIEHTLEAVTQAGIDESCLIMSKQTENFLPILKKLERTAACIQEKANGTAGAVASAAPFYKKKPIAYASYQLFQGIPSEKTYALIVNGDTPLIDPEILHDFCMKTTKGGFKLGVLGAVVPDPSGYGRLVTDHDGLLKKISEDRDAMPEEKKIKLINTGVILAHVETLFYLLAKVEPKNAQNEYYLTDIIGHSVTEGIAVCVYHALAWERFLGVNTKEQLAQLEEIIKEKI